MVNYWADLGFTSFKAYTTSHGHSSAPRSARAHARGLKVTGHLCSVTFREAADLGIDSLEHGISASTDFVTKQGADLMSRRAPATRASPRSPRRECRGSITYLVSKKVAIVSTLPVAEAGVPDVRPLQQRFLDVLSPMSRTDYLIARARTDAGAAARLKRSMDFELASRARAARAAGLDPDRQRRRGRRLRRSAGGASCWSRRGSRRSKRSRSRREAGAELPRRGRARRHARGRQGRPTSQS
jgi:hypothetical protein